MSYVTNAILLFSLSEDVEDTSEGDHYPIVDGINAWLREHYDGDELRFLSDAAGGGKAFQAVLFAGCFNFFEAEEFIAFLRTCPWQAPTDVQLLLKSEEDSRFSLVELTSEAGTDGSVD